MKITFDVSIEELVGLVGLLEGDKVEEKPKDKDPIDEYSCYARFFDEGCKGWSKDSTMNLIFLKHQQAYMDDVLRRRGYVFLNEVYDALGIPRTAAGQTVGWIYNEKCPNGNNFIDFGLTKNTESVRDFINGYENCVLLDFNVDGVIIDLI